MEQRRETKVDDEIDSYNWLSVHCRLKPLLGLNGLDIYTPRVFRHYRSSVRMAEGLRPPLASQTLCRSDREGQGSIPGVAIDKLESKLQCGRKMSTSISAYLALVQLDSERKRMTGNV